MWLLFFVCFEVLVGVLLGFGVFYSYKYHLLLSQISLFFSSYTFAAFHLFKIY